MSAEETPKSKESEAADNMKSDMEDRDESRRGPVANQRDEIARHRKRYAPRNHHRGVTMGSREPCGQQSVRLVDVHDVAMSLA